MKSQRNPWPQGARIGAGSQRSGAVVKVVVVLVGMLAIVVAAIEWSRRERALESAAPVADKLTAPLFPCELRDGAGERLVIGSRPQRIVSQTLATDEILLAICPVERIAALSSLAEDDNYSNVVEQARQLGKRSTEGAEQILLLEPDLIFVASYNRAEVVQLLKASHAPVFRFANFNTIADIQQNIRTVGQAVGNRAEAEALIEQMDGSLARVRTRVLSQKKRFRVMTFDPGGDTAGTNTTFDEMARAAGAVNVSAEQGIDGYVKISAEKIADWRPDFLVVGANRGEAEIVRKNLLADPIIAASPVGLSQRIIVIDNRHFLAVSQYVVRGVEDLADGLYGNRR
jgi:iron complex transport system substrate-binding protein